MTTDPTIDTLLRTLHAIARARHPTYGLPMFGPDNEASREQMRAAVREWVSSQSPESQR